MANVYLGIWVVAGLASLIVGYLRHSTDEMPTLAAVGKNWIGFAVAAAYAYFGISPGEQPGQGQGVGTAEH